MGAVEMKIISSHAGDRIPAVQPIALPIEISRLQIMYYYILCLYSKPGCNSPLLFTDVSSAIPPTSQFRGSQTLCQDDIFMAGNEKRRTKPMVYEWV
jgi:hypothetical protein